MVRDHRVVHPTPELVRDLGLVVEADLGGRSSSNWRVRRGDQRLVLRRHRDLLALGRAAELEAIRWRAATRGRVRDAGWPVAAAVGEPTWTGGAWWALEEWLPGAPAAMTAQTHADVIVDWHAMGRSGDAVGPQPHRLDHLPVLTDPDARSDLALCADADDRRWLLRRLEQAQEVAGRVDLGASPRVLVHVDLAPHNLLWTGSTLTGVLDLELATVDRRVVEAIHTWRCRHDDVLLAWHRRRPFNDHEWRMLLMDWWSTMVTLALHALRRGRQPDRWELDGLRRSSPLARHLESGGVGPP